jgi:hypothetical protein
MLFGETVAVYSENHTGHTDTLCGQNSGFQYVEAGGTYTDPQALKGWCRPVGEAELMTQAFVILSWTKKRTPNQFTLGPLNHREQAPVATGREAAGKDKSPPLPGIDTW